MHLPTYLYPILFLSLFVSSSAQAASGLNGTLGTTGLGVEYSIPITNKLNIRALATGLVYEAEFTEDDIDYDFEFDAISGGALFDWHPFAGGFRLTGGLVGTSFGIDLASTAAQGSFDVGDTTYTSNDLKLTGEVDFRKVAPYFGLGWASPLKNTGFSFTTEIGVMMIGKPQLSYSASGSVSVGGGVPVDVNSFPQFQEDLERERQTLEDDLEEFRIWPVITLGIGYRF